MQIHVYLGGLEHLRIVYVVDSDLTVGKEGVALNLSGEEEVTWRGWEDRGGHCGMRSGGGGGGRGGGGGGGGGG